MGIAWRDAKLRQLDTPAREERVRANERVRRAARAPKPAKAASISSTGAGAERPAICSPMTRAAASRSLNVVSVCRGMFGIDEYRHTNRPGHQLAQEFQPLRRQFAGDEIDTRHVAARPGEAGDKPEIDRVIADDEDDRDRCGCRLGSQRRMFSARADDSDLSAHQIGREGRQSIILTLCRAYLRTPRFRPRCSRSPSGPAESRADDLGWCRGDEAKRNPITGIVGCCARAASGHARRAAEKR